MMLRGLFFEYNAEVEQKGCFMDGRAAACKEQVANKLNKITLSVTDYGAAKALPNRKPLNL